MIGLGMMDMAVCTAQSVLGLKETHLGLKSQTHAPSNQGEILG